MENLLTIDWATVFTDPLTYIIMYVSSILLMIPIYKPIFKNFKAPVEEGRRAYEIGYVMVGLMAIFAPIIVIVTLLFYLGLWRWGLKPLAEKILPDNAHWPK